MNCYHGNAKKAEKTVRTKGFLQIIEKHAPFFRNKKIAKVCVTGETHFFLEFPTEFFKIESVNEEFHEVDSRILRPEICEMIGAVEGFLFNLVQ